MLRDARMARTGTGKTRQPRPGVTVLISEASVRSHLHHSDPLVSPGAAMTQPVILNLEERRDVVGVARGGSHLRRQGCKTGSLPRDYDIIISGLQCQARQLIGVSAQFVWASPPPRTEAARLSFKHVLMTGAIHIRCYMPPVDCTFMQANMDGTSSAVLAAGHRDQASGQCGFLWCYVARQRNKDGGRISE